MHHLICHRSKLSLIFYGPRYQHLSAVSLLISLNITLFIFLSRAFHEGPALCALSANVMDVYFCSCFQESQQYLTRGCLSKGDTNYWPRIWKWRSCRWPLRPFCGPRRTGDSVCEPVTVESCLGRADTCGHPDFSPKVTGVKDQNHNGHRRSLIVCVLLAWHCCGCGVSIFSWLIYCCLFSSRLKAGASKEIRYVFLFLCIIHGNLQSCSVIYNAVISCD